MYWEIDPVQMKTRYAGLSSVRDTPITVNSKWTSGHYEGGFGGAGWVIDWECPYTISSRTCYPFIPCIWLNSTDETKRK